MTNEEMIKFLQDRIEHLDKMLVQSMEMNRKLMDKLASMGDRPQLPAQPMWPTINPPIAAPNHCSKCGLKMEGVMGYVCSQPQCPTGLGGVWCGTPSNT
jgi:hypothetical protein